MQSATAMATPELGRTFPIRPTQTVGKGQRAIVVGAGPVGLLAAIFLARRGYRVHVYERRSAEQSGALWRNVILHRRGLAAVCAAGFTRADVERCGMLVTAH